jgi:hypothetical protein
VAAHVGAQVAVAHAGIPAEAGHVAGAAHAAAGAAHCEQHAAQAVALAAARPQAACNAVVAHAETERVCLT